MTNLNFSLKTLKKCQNGSNFSCNKSENLVKIALKKVKKLQKLMKKFSHENVCPKRPDHDSLSRRDETDSTQRGDASAFVLQLCVCFWRQQLLLLQRAWWPLLQVQSSTDHGCGSCVILWFFKKCTTTKIGIFTIRAWRTGIMFRLRRIIISITTIIVHVENMDLIWCHRTLIYYTVVLVIIFLPAITTVLFMLNTTITIKDLI